MKDSKRITCKTSNFYCYKDKLDHKKLVKLSIIQKAWVYTIEHGSSQINQIKAQIITNLIKGGN